MAQNGAFSDDWIYLQSRFTGKRKNGKTLCLQHVKRDMAHTAKKKKKRGLELVKDGKNCTERTKDLVQEREHHGTVSLGMS